MALSLWPSTTMRKWEQAAWLQTQHRNGRWWKPMPPALWTERRHVCHKHKLESGWPQPVANKFICGEGQKPRRSCIWYPRPSIKISALHRETGHSPDSDGRQRIETGSLRNEIFLKSFPKKGGEKCNLPPRPPPRAPTATSCPKETRERLSLINFLQLSFQWCWKVYANPPVIRF